MCSKNEEFEVKKMLFEKAMDVRWDGDCSVFASELILSRYKVFSEAWSLVQQWEKEETEREYQAERENCKTCEYKGSMGCNASCDNFESGVKL